MQQRVAGAVRCRTGADGLRTTEILALPAKRALVDSAIFEPRERHALMLQLDDQARRCTAHVFNGILVGEIVATLDRVVHVPVPVVRQYVAERGVDAALRSNSMRARGKDLGYNSHVRLRLRELQGRSQATTTRANHQAVESPTRDIAHAATRNSIAAAQNPSASRPVAVRTSTLSLSHNGCR